MQLSNNNHSWPGTMDKAQSICPVLGLAITRQSPTYLATGKYRGGIGVVGLKT